MIWSFYAGQGPARVEKAVCVHVEQNRKDLENHSGNILHYDGEYEKDHYDINFDTDTRRHLFIG